MKFNKIIPIIMILAIFTGLQATTATPTTNQTIATSFDVQNYIAIDTNASSVNFGNLTPGSNPVSNLTLNDYSNINIDVWGVSYSDFSGPQTISSGNIYGQTSMLNGNFGYFTKNVPFRLAQNWTATGSTQTKPVTLQLTLPQAVLPGHYNTTIYTYAQTAS